MTLKPVRSAAIAGLSLFLVCSGARMVAADTLAGALKSAYQTNPELLAARAAIQVAGESIAQARSGWRPNISAQLRVGLERANRSSSARQDIVPITRSLEISQSLYAGGQTENGVKQAEVNVALRRDELRQTEQVILLNTITAYMDVLQNQARLKLAENNVTVLRRQLEATKDRFGVGEVTRTDVAQSEARLSGALAEKISAQGVLAQTMAVYKRVTGRAPVDLKSAPALPKFPKDENEAVTIALRNNPSLMIAKKAEKIAALGAQIAFGKLLPRIDLIARSSRTDDASFKDFNTSSDSITAQLSIPLYQTGLVSSQVREAKQLRNQRRIELENARRAVIEEVYLSFEALLARRGEIKSRNEQVRATKIALEGVTQEAAVGSRTTLDVLNAEQELLDASVALVIAERNEYIAGYRLIAAIGKLTIRDLKVDVPAYNPEPYLQTVRKKFWGTEIKDGK